MLDGRHLRRWRAVDAQRARARVRPVRTTGTSRRRCTPSISDKTLVRSAGRQLRRTVAPVPSAGALTGSARESLPALHGSAPCHHPSSPSLRRAVPQSLQDSRQRGPTDATRPRRPERMRHGPRTRSNRDGSLTVPALRDEGHAVCIASAQTARRRGKRRQLEVAVSMAASVPRSADEPTQVVAGDVLHDGSARLDQTPVSHGERDAEQTIVACRSDAAAAPNRSSPRARQSSRRRRRCRKKPLVMAREFTVDRGERRPGAGALP